MKGSNIFKMLKRGMVRHASGILTGIGIAGMFFAIGVAIKKAPEIADKIEQEKERLDKDKLTPAETAKLVWKDALPILAISGSSAGCIIGAQSVNAKRNTALAAACTISETALSEYRSKAREVLGDKKEQVIRDAVARDTIERNPVSTSDAVKIGYADDLCFDVLSGRYFESNREKIRKAVNDVNERLLTEMYMSLNDLYWALDAKGLEPNGLGTYLGWNISDGQIEPSFSTQLSDDGRPCLVLDFYVAPRHDYRDSK